MTDHDVTVTISPESARRVLVLLAAGVQGDPDPAGRLLERVAGRDDAPELRSAPVALGAETLTAAPRRT